MTDLLEDTNHWQNLKPPLSPNEEEVAIYRKWIGDSKRVLLLGMTKELIPLCEAAVDLNPIDIGKPVIKVDWNDLNPNMKFNTLDSYLKADVVIGDGIINLTGFQFVEKALAIADKFICRVFMAKQEGMKYATWFPTEFPESSEVIHTYNDIAMVLWRR